MLGWLPLLSVFSFLLSFFFKFEGKVWVRVTGACLHSRWMYFLGPPFVFIPRAFVNPSWTLGMSECPQI